jgi:hypothetical protein
MSKSKHTITIAKPALEEIFDECDKYDSHETGGRLIGVYQKKGSHYDIQLLGVIGPGPSARRSSTSFHQDGDYQERVFRQIEEKHPNIEHLGNWHTHHVNGLATLSQGDHATYHNIVNHEMHNTDFFYALLVVKKNHGRGPRYQVKHYIFHRNSGRVDELHGDQVRILDVAPIGASDRGADGPSSHPHRVEEEHANIERAKDQDFFLEFFPELKALFSKSASALYWKGPLRLVDGTTAEVLTMEASNNGKSYYSITAGGLEPVVAEVLSQYQERRFPSARHAVLHLQDDLNRAVYRHRRG